MERKHSPMVGGKTEKESLARRRDMVMQSNNSAALLRQSVMSSNSPDRSPRLDVSPRNRNDPEYLAFLAKFIDIVHLTCRNGHELRRRRRQSVMVSTNGLFKHQEERKCFSCGDQILVGKCYMRCDESDDFCDSYYCKRCVGCPKGHLVA